MPDSTAGGFEVKRIQVIVSFRETAAFTETYGFTGSQGTVFLEGQRIIPRNHASDTVFIFMHPASTLNLMPLPLATFYQSQAENPSITHTPAGDAYDLTRADLPPADACMFIAAHTGRAQILSEWIDPSVIDEADPDTRDTAFDLYAEEGPKPPYSADFVAEFRARQLSRMRRITETVQDQLERLARSGGAEVERPFIVHRTLADPRFLDPSLEPNDRQPGRCYLGNPETVNTGPVGLARFSTLRAWLSQWSPDHSRADAEDCVARISCPFLVIENTADDAVPTSHPECVFKSATTSDKTFLRIEKATHYYREQPKQQAEVVGAIGSWLEERF